MAEPIRTKAELRRAFPTASVWWVELQLALQRDGGSLTIAVRNSRLEAAILHKLWPELYPDARPGQGVKAAATDALEDAIRPRRTGRPRPRRYTDAEIPSVINALMQRDTIGTTARYLNAKDRMLHELNDRAPLTLVKR